MKNFKTKIIRTSYIVAVLLILSTMLVVSNSKDKESLSKKYFTKIEKICYKKGQFHSIPYQQIDTAYYYKCPESISVLLKNKTGTQKEIEVIRYTSHETYQKINLYEIDDDYQGKITTKSLDGNYVVAERNLDVSEIERILKMIE